MRDDDWPWKGPPEHVNCPCYIFKIGEEAPEAVIFPDGNELLLIPYDMEPWFEKQGMSKGN